MNAKSGAFIALNVGVCNCYPLITLCCLFRDKIRLELWDTAGMERYR